MLKVLNHPLINIKLTRLRDENTNFLEFKNCVKSITTLLLFEVLASYKTKQISINTPVCPKVQGYDYDKELILVPILRAGLGMQEAASSLLPDARCGHIGLVRDELTLKPKKYLFKMPKACKNTKVLLLDPMLATGGSAKEAITCLKQAGFLDISLVCIVGVKEGVEKVAKEFKDVDIFLGALDSGLNEQGYIVPGLGDAGDRIFGTF